MKKSMRQNAGWRGLSVDLITDDSTEGGKGTKADRDGDLKEEYEIVEKDARLEGKVVRMIWQKSKLEKTRLRDIWCVCRSLLLTTSIYCLAGILTANSFSRTECDTHSQGSLDRQAFALGMWRIDCELDKAQKARRAALLSSASSRSFRLGGRVEKRT